MYLATAFPAWWRDCQMNGQTNSDLRGLKEHLDHRIVVTVLAPAHRDQDAAFAEQRLVVDRAVLRFAIRMMEPTLRPGLGDAIARRSSSTARSRFKWSLVVQPTRYRGNRSKTMARGEPALGRPNIKDVGPPFPVRAICREVVRHEVDRDGTGMFAVRRALEAPRRTAGSNGSHSLAAPCDAARSHGPHRRNCRSQARAAIGAVRQRECDADMREINHVLLLAARGRTVLLGGEAALSDPKNAAHPADREAGLFHLDEVEGHRPPPCA